MMAYEDLNVTPVVDGQEFDVIGTAINDNARKTDDNFKEVAKDIEDAKNSFPVIFGTYVGDGKAERTINLGAKPVAVEIYTKYGGQMFEYCYPFGGLAIKDHPCYTGATSANSSVIKIIDDGFTVSQSMFGRTNESDTIYYFIAFMKGSIMEVV